MLSCELLWSLRESDRKDRGEYEGSEEGEEGEEGGWVVRLRRNEVTCLCLEKRSLAGADRHELVLHAFSRRSPRLHVVSSFFFPIEA